MFQVCEADYKNGKSTIYPGFIPLVLTGYFII
jgi:hypothetical protein